MLHNILIVLPKPLESDPLILPIYYSLMSRILHTPHIYIYCIYVSEIIDKQISFLY